MTEPILVISASGIRGTVYDGLSPDLACRIACAFAALCGEGTFVVGRDTRPSGSVLNLAVASGIAAAGGRIVDIGICPTPTVQLAVEERGAVGGIAITASHNPSEWNALKLISSAGTFLLKHQVDSIAAAARLGNLHYTEPGRSAEVEQAGDACRDHIARVVDLEYVNADSIRRRNFKVVVDCVNGAGSLAAPDLLKELGCEVYGLDCEPSGVFTRNPEPTAANIGSLCSRVKERRADIGFALDPDADRLSLVDETGVPLGEDYTLAICADLVLRMSPGPLVTNLSTSMAVEEVARRHGADFHRTPIGEINVVTRMQEVGAPIGGEGNGGVILPALHYGRDALVGMALVLQVLAETTAPLSTLMKSYPAYVILKKKVDLKAGMNPERLRTDLETEFAGASFNLEDGVRVDLDGSWLHVRQSGTEPVLRLISEAATRAEAERLVSRAINVLR